MERATEKSNVADYLVILDYLQDINKIAIDIEGKIGYIWNPKLAKKLSKRKEIKV